MAARGTNSSSWRAGSPVTGEHSRPILQQREQPRPVRRAKGLRVRRIREEKRDVHHQHDELIAPKATSLGHGHVRCRERLGGVLKFCREAA